MVFWGDGPGFSVLGWRVNVFGALLAVFGLITPFSPGVQTGRFLHGARGCEFDDIFGRVTVGLVKG